MYVPQLNLQLIENGGPPTHPKTDTHLQQKQSSLLTQNPKYQNETQDHEFPLGSGLRDPTFLNQSPDSELKANRKTKKNPGAPSPQIARFNVYNTPEEAESQERRLLTMQSHENQLTSPRQAYLRSQAKQNFMNSIKYYCFSYPNMDPNFWKQLGENMPDGLYLRYLNKSQAKPSAARTDESSLPQTFPDEILETKTQLFRSPNQASSATSKKFFQPGAQNQFSVQRQTSNLTSKKSTDSNQSLREKILKK